MPSTIRSGSLLRSALQSSGTLAACAGLAFSLGACSAASPAADLPSGGGAYPGAQAAGGSGATGNGATASGGTGTGGTSVNVSTGTGGTTSTAPPPPPEMELESAFQAPVATDRYVWSANPTTGKVALIDADDFSVRLAEAGLEPTTVAALPSQGDDDAAIVLNAGSDDATILRLGADGNVRSTMLTTHSGANAVTVSPSGNWGVIWSNAALVDASLLDPTDGLQDLTVVKFGDDPATTVVSVGYRPSQVAFDAKEEHAYVVTESGMSVIDLGDAPAPESLLTRTDDPVSDASARDVNVTPDGRYAVVRVDGQKTLGFVDLASGERQTLTLDDYVTDLDLSADGTRAFAVSGGLVVVPVPPGDVDASTLPRASAPGETGRSVSLSPDASLALLYSNATTDNYLGILAGGGDWSKYDARAVDLKAPVIAVFAAPDAEHGIAFQATAQGSSKGGAFSIVSAQSDRAPKIVGTDAAPNALAFSPDGQSAVVTTRDLVKQRYGAYLVHLASLEQTFISLSSPPLAAGMVPSANRAFVAQAHPEGRITFVNLDDGSQHTLTGFELAAKVTQ
jgi:hypothetical protein